MASGTGRQGIGKLMRQEKGRLLDHTCVVHELLDQHDDVIRVTGDVGPNAAAVHNGQASAPRVTCVGVSTLCGAVRDLGGLGHPTVTLVYK